MLYVTLKILNKYTFNVTIYSQNKSTVILVNMYFILFGGGINAAYMVAISEFASHSLLFDALLLPLDLS